MAAGKRKMFLYPPEGCPGYIDIMDILSALPTVVPQNPILRPSRNAQIGIPDWNTARNLVFPLLEGEICSTGRRDEVLAQSLGDPLSGMVTNCIKMSLALFYQGAVIPLSEALIREWSINMAAVRLAMDANMALVDRSSRFEMHKKGSFYYYSLHSDAAPFTSILPFYRPFQEKAAALLGSPFYFAVPERRTVILFGAEGLTRYAAELRDDILLTYETSTRALSPELIEVSESGVLPVYR